MEFQPFSSLLELIYLIQLCDWHTHYYSVKPVYSYRLKQGNHEADKAERGVHRSPSVTLFIQLIQQRQIGDRDDPDRFLMGTSGLRDQNRRDADAAVQACLKQILRFGDVRGAGQKQNPLFLILKIQTVADHAGKRLIRAALVQRPAGDHLHR